MRILSHFVLIPIFAVPAVLIAIPAAPLLAQVAAPPPGTQAPPDSTQGQSTASPLNAIEADIANHQFADAEKQLTIYLSAHPTDDRALFDEGYCEDAEGHADAAIAAYRKALAANPKQFESHLALGLLLAGRNDPDAQEQLEAATQAQPNPPNPTAKGQAYRALARLLAKSDPNAASDDLIQALQLTGETTADTLLAAEIAENAGSFDIAEQAYRRVLAAQPSNPAAIAGLTHLLMLQKKYTDAEPMVRAALARDPDDPTLNAQLAAILAAEGKEAEAVSALEKLHQLNPQNTRVSAMLADGYLQSGEIDKAGALFAQLLQSDPSNTELLDAYGQVLIRQQKYAEAVADFQQALKANSGDIDAWSGVAFGSSKTHQYQQELDALAHRAQLTPDTPITLFLRATAYDSLHQTKQAADYYHRFLAAAQGKFPDQVWQAKHRLIALGK